ncbi:hypothetical protein ACTQ34_10480 [Agathobaculum sp. LCP25S3_E8]|uniref:hypothetical protein n=1 Tax=Agathobaculum sp. LCP25S3_E8 TaxID=3438735 RepID=UPI003F8DF369
MRGDLSVDFSGSNTMFAYISDANLLYSITDRNGTDAGLYCDALYAGPTEGSYFTIEYTYEPDADNQAYDAPYITESDYDQAYAYTNVHDVEFVITTYGDCSWAKCTTAHGTLSVWRMSFYRNDGNHSGLYRHGQSVLMDTIYARKATVYVIHLSVPQNVPICFL